MLLMKIDTGPFLNGELSFDGNAFIIKNCDNFVWTKISLLLNYYYEYTYPGEIPPNETRVMEYSDFILPEYLRNCEPPSPVRFDGKRTKQYSGRWHHAVSLHAEEGHNYITLFKGNTIYPFTSKRKPVIESYTIG
jgi:hypothetical protein